MLKTASSLYYFDASEYFTNFDLNYEIEANMYLCHFDVL